MKPDFIGIGVMKAATTWAWYQLYDHPEIRLPPQKELHYFDTLDITPERYVKCFSEKFISGEITPSYLNLPHAPILAKAICPNAKIFVILRNPVDRAFSHWKVAVWTEKKIPEGTSFIDAFELDHPVGLRWHTIKERGLYIKYIKRWHKEFPHLKIMWHDDIENHPLEFLKELYGWLGVDANFIPKKYNKKINKNWSGKNPVFSPEDRNKVLEYYLPSIERLERFTGRDLSRWKK